MPTATCACEYVSGSISTLSKAKYFTYFIMNPLLSDPVFAGCDVRGVLRRSSVFFSLLKRLLIGTRGNKKSCRLGSG